MPNDKPFVGQRVTVHTPSLADWHNQPGHVAFLLPTGKLEVRVDRLPHIHGVGRVITVDRDQVRAAN